MFTMPFDSELLPGARNAVETCLAVQPRERVFLIADDDSREVAASLAAALDAREARWTGYRFEDFSPLAAGALQDAAAGILCVQPRPGELAARRAIVSQVEQHEIRYAHMVGVTPKIMRQGMRADYHAVNRLSERLLERMTEVRSLRVQSPAGTHFSATFHPMFAWVKTSGLINSRYWSNLPAGEVFTTLPV